MLFLLVALGWKYVIGVANWLSPKVSNPENVNGRLS